MWTGTESQAHLVNDAAWLLKPMRVYGDGVWRWYQKLHAPKAALNEHAPQETTQLQGHEDS
jgi:hypothetical protein